MAPQRDPQHPHESHRVEPLAEPTGYVLPKGQHMRDVLAIQADLLRSEGIDPSWPGFDDDPSDK